ncbi:MAG: 2-octaprenyl-6-methoxyphenyl hydroxylase [Gammaproteobacteria bacterium]
MKKQPQSEKITDYPVVISGGGLVGASLAVALGQAGIRVAVIEAREPETARLSHYDERTIALAQGSRHILSGLGIWPALSAAVCPIKTIHVSERGHFGFTRLRHDQEKVEALGYVAPAHAIAAALHERLADLDTVDFLAPADVVDLAFPEEADPPVMLDVDVSGYMEKIRAELLVAADGAQSSVRDRLSIETAEHDYGQTAIVTNLTPENPHKHIAYERFTETGPMALLPMNDNRCGLVWTLPSEAVDDVLALDDAAFLARVQERFGYRLGRFLKTGQRISFPLRMIKASESIRPRLALIGNAMHTLHPVAGQGFNLGLRDVAALAEVIVDARKAGENIGDIEVLQRYQDWRRRDQSRVLKFTDGLVRLFAMPYPPLRWLRNGGMVAMDVLPPAKRWFGKLTMGRAGRLPRLARGLRL